MKAKKYLGWIGAGAALYSGYHIMLDPLPLKSRIKVKQVELYRYISEADWLNFLISEDKRGQLGVRSEYILIQELKQMQERAKSGDPEDMLALAEILVKCFESYEDLNLPHLMIQIGREVVKVEKELKSMFGDEYDNARLMSALLMVHLSAMKLKLDRREILEEMLDLALEMDQKGELYDVDSLLFAGQVRTHLAEHYLFDRTVEDAVIVKLITEAIEIFDHMYGSSASVDRACAKRVHADALSNYFEKSRELYQESLDEFLALNDHLTYYPQIEDVYSAIIALDGRYGDIAHAEKTISELIEFAESVDPQLPNQLQPIIEQFRKNGYKVTQAKF
jgi:hypothetical protein